MTEAALASVMALQPIQTAKPDLAFAKLFF
jgi:hypothetical protein